MSFEQDAVIIEPASRHRASVIWLHGLGADGHDFEPVAPELGLPAGAGARFIFPHAPFMAVTINGGQRMRAWYDIRCADLRQQEDTAAIRASAELIEHYIRAEQASGIPARRIILAGFSQGGALALHTGLRYADSLGGIIALSTYLPLPDRLRAEATDANRASPVFMAHGRADPVIPLAQGQATAEALRQAGYAVGWHEYEMPHAVCPQEITAIGAWLSERLVAGHE